MMRETPSDPNSSHGGKWVHCEWAPGLSRCAGHSPDAHFFLTSPRKLRWWARLRDWERLGAQQSGLRTHQRTVDVSRTPSRRPSMSFLGYLSHGAPSWPRGNPNAPRASPPPASWLSPVHPDRWSEQAFVGGVWEHAESLASTQNWEHAHKLEHFRELLQGTHTEGSQHLAWLCRI